MAWHPQTVLTGGLALLLPLTAAALEPAAPEGAGADTPLHYVVGLTAALSPEYAGSDRQTAKLRPLWGLRWGRFRLSSSRASGLMDHGVVGSGASADVLETARWRVNVGLRIDQGRDAASSGYLTGLPDIRSTLRARVAAGYTIDARWSLGASISQDLLGRGGGVQAGMDLAYAQRLTPDTTWNAGAGIGLGNGVYMRSHFGIAPTDAANAGIAAFRPVAGVRDVHAGLGLTTQFTSRWVGYAGLGWGTLAGDAARSPLTRQAAATSVLAGLAYRCCR